MRSNNRLPIADTNFNLGLDSRTVARIRTCVVRLRFFRPKQAKEPAFFRRLGRLHFVF